MLAGLAGSGFLAGFVNSIAGGGTLLTFPALLAVVSPLEANASSTLSVFPGTLASAWAYRQDVQHPPKLLLWLLGPSFAGGLVGTLLVTRTKEEYFALLIPWLILVAALLFALQPILTRYTTRFPALTGELPPNKLLALSLIQFIVGVYGGYFGAGMGILMLTALSYMGFRELHSMNAIKTLLAGGINGIAAVIFIHDGLVRWQYTVPMATGAIVGGYLGPKLAMRLPQKYVRQFVIFIGLALALYYFYKQHFI